jgi:catechol 2,3-dioxygenase-like lactoylglutathione lyase family enzyme
VSRVLRIKGLLHALPQSFGSGNGIRQIIWGVDSQHSLEIIETELRSNRQVRKDSDGRIFCLDDAGLSIGFSVFDRKALPFEAELTNTPNKAMRWNKNRKWFSRATPQLIHHVVFACPEHKKAARFYRDRLKFRVTDVLRDRGIFLRADGRSDHHNIFWLKSDRPRFVHISFGVQNFDELVAGANHMQRSGWVSKLGVGRHRLSSTIFFYLDNPSGGEAEYSADTDCLDDSWRPRVWDPIFANYYWVAQLPDSLMQVRQDDVAFLSDIDPDLARIPE